MLTKMRPTKEKRRGREGNVSREDALEASQLAVRYLEQGEIVHYRSVFTMKCRDNAFNNALKTNKMKPITNFFKSDGNLQYCTVS